MKDQLTPPPYAREDRHYDEYSPAYPYGTDAAWHRVERALPGDADRDGR